MHVLRHSDILTQRPFTHVLRISDTTTATKSTMPGYDAPLWTAVCQIILMWWGSGIPINYPTLQSCSRTFWVLCAQRDGAHADGTMPKHLKHYCTRAQPSPSHQEIPIPPQPHISTRGKCVTRTDRKITGRTAKYWKEGNDWQNSQILEGWVQYRIHGRRSIQ